MTKILHDIHTYLLITITTLLALYLNFLGTLGLVVYGLLIAYSVVFIFMNYRRREQYKQLPPIFFILIAYYCYFILAVSVNGSFTYNGPAIIQLFLLAFICFFRNDTNEMLYDVNNIAKVFTIFGLAMSIGSISIASFTLLFPNLVNTFPSALAEKFFAIKGSFPSDRLPGLCHYPNPTSLACLTSILFSFYLISIESKKKWIIPAIINICTGSYVIIIASNSRTNMVCLAAFIFFYYIFYFFILHKNDQKKRKIRNIIVIVFLTAVILFAIILIGSASFRDFFFNHVLRVSSIKDASGRDDVYKISYELGQGKRFLGYDMHDLVDVGLPNAHNIFLQLLCAGGIPSLVLFCLWFFFSIYASIRNVLKPVSKEARNLNGFFACFIVCYLLQGLPEIAGVDIMSPFSIAAQVIFAYINVNYFNYRQQKIK